MELRHLRYFVAVAEELNFRAAARRLNISQPPLSVQVAALEGEIGARLFDRSGAQVSLTEAGRVFLPEAKRTLALAERAAQAARQHDRRPSVVLGCTEAIMFAILTDALRAFTKNHPDIKIALSTEAVLPTLDAMLNGDVHVAIFRSLVSRAGLEAQVFHREPFVVVLPQGHRLAARSSVRLADLHDEDFISFPRHLAPATYDLITSLCLRIGFTPRITQEVYGHLGILGLAAAGIGVTLLPESVSGWAPPGVVFRPVSDIDTDVETVVAWRKGDRSSETQALVSAILGTRSARRI